mmetsp:Transcript_57538/g.132646  ORF Transcript_57538/g.132646 Transcript_57538/m.132646 type:complete len:138 (+) Transcript_57538:16-429(+)
MSPFLSGVGVAVLVVAPVPSMLQVHFANGIAALGYGALLAVIPVALRLHFPQEHLGLLYGVLYVWTGAAVPFWGLWSSMVPGSCSGYACYRFYCAMGCLGMLVSCLLVAVQALRESRRPVQASSRLSSIEHSKAVPA